MKRLYFVLIVLLISCNFFHSVQAQVLNPNDPVLDYDTANLPSVPAWDSIGKWVRTPHFGTWTNSYKAYYYKGMSFRLMFPKSWTPGSTKKYPMVIFLHGLGENGTIYDNEWSLRWEGQNFVNAENNGSFDGFVMFPQSQNGFWGEPYYQEITQIIDYMVKNVKLDINQVLLSGLSAGGSGDWAFLTSYPKYFAGAEIISSAYTDLKNYINNPLKYIPIWLSQGQLDGNPAPYTSQQIVNALQNVGADITYTVYPNVGHGVWDLHYAEPDTYPWFNRKNKTNPIVFFGQSEFCPSDTSNINITLGLTPGFDGYEWRKNGVIIAGANSNTLTVSGLGTYDARIRRGNDWSYWSASPVVVKVKEATQTPDIQVDGIMSRVIPSPDGKTSVNLILPSGYASYEWRTQGGSTVLGTQQSFTANQPGNYVAKVTEKFGCSSNFSVPFNVANNSGPNPPDPATNLSAFATSQTEIQLNWNNNPNPTNNETGFEIYRSQTAGGPYTLIHINAADSLSYLDNSLTSNTNYFYIVRAVDSTGAAAPSAEIGTITLVDKIPPDAPVDLKATATTRSSVKLIWDAAADNVGIARYAIYVNGAKSYVTTDTTFTVNSLTQGQLYTFSVKAQDQAGNYSPMSNQISAPAIFTGLNYSYYTFTGTWNSLPDFNTLVPTNTGTSPNVNIALATQEDNFSFKWTGYIQIPTSGSYTFFTNSDDGSRLYIDTPYSYMATPLVNNDGLHGTTLKSGTVYLSAGTHPITITYYEQGGGQVMEVYWQSTALNNNNTRTLIPDSAFRDPFNPGGVVPESPSHIKANAISYKEVDLSWSDNSADEQGFEIYRASSLEGPYSIVATTASNVESFSDSTCAPQTTYFYKVQAINQYGASGFNLADLGGLNYQYYSVASGLSKLPDFNSLTPSKTGIIPNITLDPRTTTTNFAFKFAGTIAIDSPGVYTFYTKSDDNSDLYIGGFSANNLVVNNDYLQGATERHGNITLAKGNYPIYITYMQQGGDYVLTASYSGPGISKQLIPNSVFANPDMAATTFALPAIPSMPSNLAGTSTSPSTIAINWTDNSSNEDGFEIYRSVNNNSNFLLLASVGANKTNYVDSSLYPNAQYFYKVLAFNVGGESDYSNQIAVKTLDNPPVLSKIGSVSMRYGTVVNLDLLATDSDNEHLTFEGENLPAFVSLSDYGDGSGLLTLAPSSDQQGVFKNVKIRVSDQNGGADSSIFDISVDDNYPPVIRTVSNITISAGESMVDTLFASDENSSDVINWTAEGLPSFVSMRNSTGDTLYLEINPNLNDGGVYDPQFSVNDGNGGKDEMTLNLTVSKFNPDSKIYINFSSNDPSFNEGGYWNNTDAPPTNSLNIGGLIDDGFKPTSIGIQIVSPWQNVGGGYNILGTSTGNNSGIYPDSVLQSAYWTNSALQQIKVYGLIADDKHSYDFTFLGSRSGTGNRNTNYSIGDTTVILNASNNTSNTVTIDGIIPDSTGAAIISIGAGNGSTYGYLNAMVITVHYNDGAIPAIPTKLTASIDSGVVDLSWHDNAYNETGYEVFKSESENGTYELIGTVAANDTLYVDSSIIGNAQYFYKVRSINGEKASDYSAIANIIIPRQNPSISPVGDLTVNAGGERTIEIEATPGETGSQLVLSATNLPTFGTFEDLGNGHGEFSFSPTSNDVGVYSDISLKVADNLGGSSVETFSIKVVDSSQMRVLVNFNQDLGVGLPWNSTNSAPSIGLSLPNLIDDAGVPTGIGLELEEWWDGANAAGKSTGNNSGVYPDSVMLTSYYIGNNSTKHILISGLSSDKSYNFTFFGSRDANDNRITYFSIGDTTVSLNAAGNTQNVVKILGRKPDVNGNITVSIYKDANASYGYLNAMVIELAQNNGLPATPSNLIAVGTSSSSINLTWRDNANDETGYEIWRSQTLDGTYSLVNTVGENITAYKDSNLAQNTRYFYKVRSVEDSLYSGYSNNAAATTLLTAMYVNFNQNSPASAPWNNTNIKPLEGGTYGPLKDQAGNNTGIQILNMGGFQDVNELGMNTGNNSGVFPDNVIFDNFWLNKGDTAVLKLSGLNLTMRYNLVFFASREASDDRTTMFMVNNTAVSLQAAGNISNTVQISNIAPDENGEVVVKIYAGDNSTYGYISALVIQEYSNYDDNGELISNPQLVMLNSSSLIHSKIAFDDGSNFGLIKVYPNPFIGMLHISLKNTKDDGETVFSLYDVNGKLVYQRNEGVLTTGVNSITLDLGSLHLANKVYILKVYTSRSHKTDTWKLIHVK